MVATFENPRLLEEGKFKRVRWGFRKGFNFNGRDF
jgi:hypothetical protein